MKRFTLLVASILACNSAQAAVSCDKKFDGSWVNYVGSGGQCSSSSLIIYGNAAMSTTRTVLNGRASKRCIPYTKLVFKITYHSEKAQISAKKKGAKCVLKFSSRPDVFKDLHNASRRLIAREATLTKISKNKIRWCWTEKDHDYGKCATFYREK